MKKHRLLTRDINPVPGTGLVCKLPKDTTPPVGKSPAPARYPVTDIAIVTIPREGIHRTLASLLMNGVDGDIFLVVGRPDARYLEVYRHHSRIHIVPLGADEWEAIKHQPVSWLSCHNYLRALSVSSNNILVVEDDTIFCDSWQGDMERIITEIEQVDRHHDYFLTLYSGTLVTTRTTRPYSLFPYLCFWGTQCIYYPNRVLARTKQFWKEALQMEDFADEIKGDIVLNKFAEDQGIPIFTPKYSLVQHVGQNSSLESTPHESPSFLQADVTFPEMDTWWSVGPEMRMVLYHILKLGLHSNVLEIGSYNGYSTAAFLAALDHGANFSLTVCDIDIKPQVRKMAERHPVTFLQARSEEIIDGKYDLIFVDGDHSLPAVSREIMLLLHHKVKTIIAHDTMPPGKHAGPVMYNQDQRHVWGSNFLKQVFDAHRDYHGITLHNPEKPFLWLGMSIYSLDKTVVDQARQVAQQVANVNVL